MIDINITKKLHGVDGDLNLHFATKINTSELVSIYGPSGAGKTTILRMLAGLSKPDSGIINADGKKWFDKNNNINVTPQLRNIGMVFQEFSLFPNMTVRGNLEFALKKNQPKKIVDELLALIELEKLYDKKPFQLSGGQKQRVALARALVNKPRLLLLDEPLSALDMEMQHKLQDYILNVHHQFNLTTVLISHDIPEVIKMSKRVIIFENGNIMKEGSAKDVLPLSELKMLFH
jgi:molybdate transport system ATP-binding protein